MPRSEYWVGLDYGMRQYLAGRHDVQVRPVINQIAKPAKHTDQTWEAGYWDAPPEHHTYSDNVAFDHVRDVPATSVSEGLTEYCHAAPDWGVY